MEQFCHHCYFQGHILAVVDILVVCDVLINCLLLRKNIIVLSVANSIVEIVSNEQSKLHC